MTSKTEEPKALLEGIGSYAWEIGWRLRELGVGVVISNQDGTVRLTPYRPEAGEVVAGLPALATEALTEGLTDGWQCADECPIIDESR
ncbi:hypothetical protein [Bradyrhizobium embrapense]